MNINKLFDTKKKKIGLLLIAAAIVASVTVYLIGSKQNSTIVVDMVTGQVNANNLAVFEGDIISEGTPISVGIGGSLTLLVNGNVVDAGSGTDFAVNSIGENGGTMDLKLDKGALAVEIKNVPENKGPDVEDSLKNDEPATDSDTKENKKETESAVKEGGSTEAKETEAKGEEESGTEVKETETAGKEGGSTEAKETEAKGEEEGSTEVKEADTALKESGSTEAKETEAKGEEEGSTEVKEADIALKESGSTEAKATEAKGEEEGSTEVKEADTALKESKSTEAKGTEAKGEEESSTEVKEADTAFKESKSTEAKETEAKGEEESSTEVKETEATGKEGSSTEGGSDGLEEADNKNATNNSNEAVCTITTPDVVITMKGKDCKVISKKDSGGNPITSINVENGIAEIAELDKNGNLNGKKTTINPEEACLVSKTGIDTGTKQEIADKLALAMEDKGTNAPALEENTGQLAAAPNENNEEVESGEQEISSETGEGDNGTDNGAENNNGVVEEDTGAGNTPVNMQKDAFVMEGKVYSFHNHKKGNTVTMANPTCTVTGYKNIYCATCGEVMEKETIDSLGHDYVKSRVKEPNCKDTGIDREVCSRCGDTIDKEIPKTDEHKFGKYTIIQESTCTKNEIQERVCSVCGRVEYITGTMIPHVYGDEELVSETEINIEGKDYIRKVYQKKCLMCERVEERMEDTEVEE